MSGLPSLTEFTVITHQGQEIDVLPLIEQHYKDTQRRELSIYDLRLDSLWCCKAECLITDKWGHSFIWKKDSILKLLVTDTLKTYKVRLYEDSGIGPDLFIEEAEYWYSMPFEQFKLVAEQVG